MFFFRVNAKTRMKKNRVETSLSLCFSLCFVPGAGLEPAQPNGHRILSPACLPIPPPGRKEKIPLGRIEGFRAENEIRTRDPNLGKVVLYQLSYFRFNVPVLRGDKINKKIIFPNL